jgi:hypothetical protein
MSQGDRNLDLFICLGKTLAGGAGRSPDARCPAGAATMPDARRRQRTQRRPAIRACLDLRFFTFSRLLSQSRRHDSRSRGTRIQVFLLVLFRDRRRPRSSRAPSQGPGAASLAAPPSYRDLVAATDSHRRRRVKIGPEMPIHFKSYFATRDVDRSTASKLFFHVSASVGLPQA